MASGTCHRLLQMTLLNRLYFLKMTTRNNYTFTNFSFCLNKHASFSYGPHFNHSKVGRSGGTGGTVWQHSRYMNTSNINSSSEQPVEKLSIFQRFKKILKNFYNGGMVLYQDIKVTLKIRRKLKANHGDHSILKRKEQWTMFKTQKNLKKTLPIIILSCFPVIGYLGPIIGFLRPREFLSHHFWTAKQRKKYQILDDKERSKYLGIILKNVRNETEKITDKEQQSLILNLTEKANEDYNPANDILIKTLPTFTSGVFKFENLERDHLKNVSSFWLLSSWLPTSWLQKRLIREMEELYKDDAAIIREGINNLTDKEINEACHVRGLNTSNVSSEDLVKWLQVWIDLTKQVSETNTSFLAHAAVFKTATLKQGTLQKVK